jgi:hypothetical protein
MTWLLAVLVALAQEQPNIDHLPSHGASHVVHVMDTGGGDPNW